MEDPFGIAKMGGGNSSPPQHKPKIGRGAYVNSPGKPHWHQNVHRPKFVANALINNPDVAASVAGGAAAGVALSQRDKASPKGKQHIDEGVGAAGGAALGMAHSQHKGFKVKRWAQDPKNNDDWQKEGKNNPRPGPHKKAIVDLQRDSRAAAAKKGGSKRAYQQHYDAHFPEGLKTTKARKWLSTGHGKYAAGAMLVGAGAGGAAAFGAHKAKDHLEKRKHDPVQDEIDRRKKISAAGTRISSTGGLLAVGALGAGALAPHGVGTSAGKMINLTEKGAKEFKAGTRAHATGLTVVSGGVGGLNGFNNAKIQSMEASQRKKKATMVKSHNPSPFEDGGYFGEISKYYDPEENRKKRADLYENAASAGAGAAAAGAIHQGVGSHKDFKDAKSHFGGDRPKVVFDEKKYKSFKTKRGRAGLLAAGAGAAVYGAKKIHDKKDSSWQPYSKALGGTPGMGAMRPAPSAAKFKPLGQRPVSANVKNMRKVPLANGGGPSGGGGGGVGNTAGLSGVGKSADYGIFND